MRKVIILFCCVFSITACNDGVPKPDNLIAKDKMIDILYDISLLEAIKTQNINGGMSSKMSNDYIYKKYKIDSIQFTKSNKYYASDLEGYKSMFEAVKEKLNKKTLEIEAEVKKNGGTVPPVPNSTLNSDTPQVQ
ncbi:MAG: DUF4296 domain-containing protein [Flavobacterium sp. JAD_PAG50586_2]|nr:MAG: DUF4296 domain-containing protein [Flavobacterium sp. JAD_PAG50586_2]